MSETTIWQPDAIEKLRDQLGDEDGVLVREIIQLYLVQARELLAQLEVAARQADEYQIRGLAHSLKGSTATVGGGRLAAACDQIEHASSAELGCPEVWPCVQREFELLAAELERYRPFRGAGWPGRRPSTARGGRSAGRFPA
jgi:HPt (histidine-containing phosphotransfer) domain-containing protein